MYEKENKITRTKNLGLSIPRTVSIKTFFIIKIYFWLNQNLK
jgi:hypothetical protein